MLFLNVSSASAPSSLLPDSLVQQENKLTNKKANKEGEIHSLRRELRHWHYNMLQPYGAVNTFGSFLSTAEQEICTGLSQIPPRSQFTGETLLQGQHSFQAGQMSPLANEVGSVMPSAPSLGHHKETRTVFKHYSAAIPTSVQLLHTPCCASPSCQQQFHGAQQVGFSTTDLAMTTWHREHPRGGRAKAALL